MLEQYYYFYVLSQVKTTRINIMIDLEIEVYILRLFNYKVNFSIFYIKM